MKELIKTVGFNPLKVEVNGIEVPVVEHSYQDENDKAQAISYVVVNGEKKVIQYRVELLEDLSSMKMDEVLTKVEKAREEKLNPK